MERKINQIERIEGFVLSLPLKAQQFDQNAVWCVVAELRAVRQRWRR